MFQKLQLSALVAMSVSARVALAASATVLMFPNSDCNSLGVSNSINANEGSCTETFLGDNDYNKTNDQYDAYLSLQGTDLPSGCSVVIARASTDATPVGCGECIGQFHTANQCTLFEVPDHYYTTYCCGDECNTACAHAPGKRDVPAKAPEEIASLKSRSPFSSKKAKRADCKFTPDGGLFSIAGNPVSVSNTYQPCQSDNGCSQSYSGTVESSFSNTFEVSESTEAGFFDIVSETVSFSYSHTYEQSSSSTVTGMYTYSKGQSGYMTFSPLSQCNKGTFSGADCDGMGIPTGGDSRQACVPEKTSGGMPMGDINIVTTV